MQRASTPSTVTAFCLALLLGIGAATAALASSPAPLPETRDDREVRTERKVVVLSTEDGPRQPAMLRLLSGAYLGVELTRLTPELRLHFGVPDDRGVLVARVEEGSPAGEAGLAVGDVVTSIDGEAVETPWDLSVAVRRHEGGDRVDLEVWRDGRPLDFAATLGERERHQIELGRLLEEGKMEELEGMPRLRWFRHSDEEGEDATVWIEPGMAERLEKTLREIELPPLDGALRERNRELEQRLKRLEQRLQELEQRLDEAEAPRR